MSAPFDAAPVIDALLQILDDMGVDGDCCCLLAKAQARVAIEPFLEDDDGEGLMSYEDAKNIVDYAE